MESVQSIREHIKSLESTGHITKSMKMVSSSKLKRTQNLLSRNARYAARSKEMLTAVLPSVRKNDSPLLDWKREIRTVCYVLIMGNRGLCGIFNTELLKYAANTIAGRGLPYRLYVLGRWGFEHVESTGLNVYENRELKDVPDSEECRTLCEELQKSYVSGDIDEIDFLYDEYKTVQTQVPATYTLLPLPPAVPEDSSRKMIFEPDRREVLETLLRVYLESTVFDVCLQARMSEHAARRMAMTTASDNTDEMITHLNLMLNHARQAEITTEIAEIIGGTEALRNTPQL